MAAYNDGISPAIREMVTQINKVGVGKLKRYCKMYHPAFNFDLALSRIREVAKTGYRYASYKLNVSEQRLYTTLKQCYKFAMELEEMAGMLDDGY